MPHSLPRRALFGACFASLALLAPGLASAQDLGGTYRAEGMNPNGSRYEGRVEIQQSGDAVALAWEVAGRTYTGTGTQEDRVVEIDWGDSSPVVYVVMSNGELHGTWADGKGLEKLIPQ